MNKTTDTHHTIYERWLEGKHGLIRYWESSPHQGTPIVLIHGYGGLIEHWWRIMRPLAQHHTIYALDLYGFGYSSRLRVEPSKEVWADEVADLISKVLPDPAVVVGHSMGGVIAAQVARDYPDFVRGLVLVDSTGIKESEGNSSPIERIIVGAIRAPILGEMLSGLLSNKESIRQSLLSAYHRKDRVTPALIESFSRPLRQPGRVNSYLAASRAFERLMLNIQPGEVRAPTLILWGAEDIPLPPYQASLIKQRMFPDADIHIIPDAGHCPFDETPEEFCTILLDWMKTLQT